MSSLRVLAVIWRLLDNLLARLVGRLLRLSPVDPKPRTPAENLAFEKAWDSRVEAGWVRNGKPSASTHRGGYPGSSIIGSRETPEQQRQRGWLDD
jgi:hypothetical protein